MTVRRLRIAAESVRIREPVIESSKYGRKVNVDLRFLEKNENW